MRGRHCRWLTGVGGVSGRTRTGATGRSGVGGVGGVGQAEQSAATLYTKTLIFHSVHFAKRLWSISASIWKGVRAPRTM